jgi:hypothetical protein
VSLRILILADAFVKPSFAPRLRFLCNYLTEQGHDIEVFTEKWDTIPFAHTYPIHEIPLMENTNWVLKTFINLIVNIKERLFARRVLQQIQGKKYDLVFCTTFSTFPLVAGSMIARKLQLPYITDIRDLDEQICNSQYIRHRQWYLRPFSKIYQRVSKRRRNQAIRIATAVTTISPWHKQYIEQHITAGTNISHHLIYNGYDPEQFYPEDIPADVFRITYIGRLYEFQKPALQMLQKAVSVLGLPNVQLSLPILTGDYIPIDRVGDAIRESSVMVVLTNQQAKGMMTTKFFEALGCEKPVLCIPSDQGLLAQTIKDTNAGETADTIEEIKSLLEKKYKEWQQHGFTRQQVVQEAKQQFDRTYQARQFDTLFHQTTR